LILVQNHRYFGEPPDALLNHILERVGKLYGDCIWLDAVRHLANGIGEFQAEVDHGDRMDGTKSLKGICGHRLHAVSIMEVGEPFKPRVIFRREFGGFQMKRASTGG
ncbi:MAG: hypothetical protein PVJ62_00865, partial [Deltaproteobacteria bacterium]|jgi:hypothetical protein